MGRRFTLLVSLAAILVAVIVLSGCAGIVRGSGRLDTREYDFSDFTDVSVGGAFEVDVVQGNDFSVAITADDNVFRYIEVEKSGRTLKIGTESLRGLRNVTLRAEITMPKIEALTLSGAVRGTLTGFRSTDDFRLNLSGASTLNGEVEVRDARFNVSGASRATLEGSADVLTLDVSGASRLDLADFAINEADVELSGASTATINVKDTLDVELSGASTLNYAGDPKIGRQSVTGASNLRRR